MGLAVAVIAVPGVADVLQDGAAGLRDIGRDAGGDADGDSDGFAGVVIPFYTVFWISFSIVYLGHTHLVHQTADPHELMRVAGAQTQRGRTLRARLFGVGGAASWTVSGALVAALLTVAIAGSPAFRADPVYIVLGLGTVGASWLMMVYGYALHYLRLHAAGERIEFELGGGGLWGGEGTASSSDAVDIVPEFGDFLTMSFLMSTMAAVSGGQIRTRAVWRTARIHTVLAFIFNTVIVAMTVSLLFGGLGG